MKGSKANIRSEGSRRLLKSLCLETIRSKAFRSHSLYQVIEQSIRVFVDRGCL